METKELWLQYKKSPSTELKNEIILKYQNLIHYVINKTGHISYHITDHRDYFQIGIEGLSQAIDRFDPEFGTKFETYAFLRIRGKMIDELRKMKYQSYSSDGKKKVLSMISINSKVNDHDVYSIEDILPSNNDTPVDEITKKEMKKYLIELIKELSERDRQIIVMYYYGKYKFKEIALALDLTISRVSQLHSRIMKTLKLKLQDIYAEELY